MKKQTTIIAFILIIFVIVSVIWAMAQWKEAEEIPESPEIPVTTTEPEVTEPELMSMEDFLASVEEGFNRDSYVKIFDIYGYEEFMTRSEIPHYFQTMYTQRFATGTIRTSGCGITCLSMVVSYLYDTTITPDMMLIYDNRKSPASAFEKGIREMKLNCEKHYGMSAIDNLDAALEAGSPVIALMNSKSIFTDYGHFILITGKTEEGTYLVNDPNLENYYKLYYKDEFLNGFTRKHITTGLKGIYIFDPKEGFQGDPSLLPNAT